MTSQALANETTTYKYDALGRLVATARAGGPNDAVQTTTVFDPAGNRTTYAVAGGNSNPPVLSIGNASATEGGNLVFTVTRAGNTSVAVSANYATANGSATSGSDYTATSGTVSFAAGQTTATITVPTIDDSVYEPTETMTVTLSSPTGGATIGTATGTGTITDNDPAPSTFSIGNASATEGGNLVFTVTRTGNTATPANVNYATANGTATAGSDYTATSGTLTFAAGQTSATITVPTIDDSVYEPTETMTVSLSAPTGGAGLGIASGTGTITDNDPAPSTLSIGNASATEGGSLVFTVTRSGATTTAVTANYATANGTAVAGSDYTANSGTISFAAGETSKTITVATIDDAIPESTEAMTVSLSAPTGGATIGTATGTGTIADNDANATLAIGNASVTEGGNLVFTVTRSGNTGFAVSVNYATVNGTATAGSDYTAASGTLSFAAGQTTATITVPTIDDSVYEPTETMAVALSGGSSGTTITTATGTGIITDNDIPNPVAVADSVTFVCSADDTLNVVANDYDPNGLTPLTLVSVSSTYSGPSGARATLVSTTSMRMGATQPRSYVFHYVVQNSLGGTAAGNVSANITGKSQVCIRNP
jgi:hypothetical protein